MSSKSLAYFGFASILGLITAAVSILPATAQAPPALPPEAEILNQLDEARVLQAEGRHAEAGRLLDEITRDNAPERVDFQAHPPHEPEFLAEHRPPERFGDRPRARAEEMRAMWKKMKELKEQGKDEEADALRRKLREKGREMFRAAMADRPHDPHARERGELGKKMRDLYQELRELREAGKKDEAEKVHEELRKLRKEMLELMPPHVRERMKKMRHHKAGHRVPEELRAELKETHEKIRALQKEGKTEEAQKLRREMGEKMRKHFASKLAARGDRPGPPHHWGRGPKGPHRDRAKYDRDGRDGPSYRKGKYDGPRHHGPRYHGPPRDGWSHDRPRFGGAHHGPGGPPHHRPPFHRGADHHFSGSPELQKVHHLRVAAMHLQKAGYEEYAKKAQAEAGRLQHKIRDSRQGVPAREVRELRAKVERLEHHVRKLHHKFHELKKYRQGNPNDDEHDQDEEDDDDRNEENDG